MHLIWQSFNMLTNSSIPVDCEKIVFCYYCPKKCLFVICISNYLLFSNIADTIDLQNIYRFIFSMVYLPLIKPFKVSEISAFSISLVGHAGLHEVKQEFMVKAPLYPWTKQEQ